MRQFLKQTLASTIGTIVGLGLMGLVSIGGLIALLVALAATEKEPELTADTILTLDLSQEIRDAPLGNREALAGLLAGQSSEVLPLRTILESLEAAAEDDRIQGIYISGQLDTTAAGFATLMEVREALQRFREKSNKPVIAYGVGWSEREYFVTSAAGEVLLNPYGTLEMNGFSSQGTFWAGALEKYGIGVQVVRAGSYKSAVEPFTQTERSAESREQSQALLGSLWTDFLMEVGGDRDVDPKQLLAIARSQGIFRGEQASQAQLVDGMAYEDQVLDKLAKLAPAQDGDEPFEGMALDDYFEIIQTSDSAPEDMAGENPPEDAPPADGAVPKEDAPEAPDQSHAKLIPMVQPGLPGQRRVWLNPPTPDDVQDGEATPSPASTGSPPSEASPEASASPEAEGTDAPAPDMAREANEVAVVYATGAIVPGRGTPDQIGGDRLAKTLRELRQDQTVAAVVLRLNSRGGSATASEIIAREVELTAQEKPVVVSMGDYAASGGYWISAPADEIVAEPTTITGSIGVFGLLPNVQKLGENNGVTWDSIQTGPLANLQTITRPKSDAELALLQSSVDWVYGQFIAKVAEGRSLETSTVEEIAQGRVWSGRAAEKVGLVDQLGGLETAIARAAELAELGDDWTIQEYPKSKGFGSLLPFSSSSSLDEALAELLITAGDRLGIWAWLSESRSVEQVALAHWTAWRAQLDWLATLNDPNGTYAKSFDAWDIR